MKTKKSTRLCLIESTKEALYMCQNILVSKVKGRGPIDFPLLSSSFMCSCIFLLFKASRAQ